MFVTTGPTVFVTTYPKFQIFELPARSAIFKNKSQIQYLVFYDWRAKCSTTDFNEYLTCGHHSNCHKTIDPWNNSPRPPLLSAIQSKGLYPIIFPWENT